MVKKSVSKVVSNMPKQLKSVLNTQSILSSVIVILLVVYMTFVNSSNVPRLFNNIIVKLVLFALVAYTFFQDKLVAVFLAITIILSISLIRNPKGLESTSVPIFNDEEENLLHPKEEFSLVEEESMEPLSTKLPSSSNNLLLNGGPVGVPSSGLNISTHSPV